MADDEEVPTYPVPPRKLEEINANSVRAGAGGIPGARGVTPPLSAGIVPQAAPQAAPAVGGLSSLNMNAILQQMQLEAQARRAAQQEQMSLINQQASRLGQGGIPDLDRASMLFQIAGALAAPTRTGSFMESLGAAGTAVSGPLAKAAQAERERQDKIAQLQLVRAKLAGEMGTGDISGSDMLQLMKARAEMTPKISEKERLYQMWQNEQNPQRKKALSKMLGIGDEDEKEEVKNVKLLDGNEISVVRRGGKSYDPITNELLDEAKLNALAASTKASDRHDQALELGVPVETADPFAALPPKDREKARVARYNADTRVLQKEAAEVPDSVLRDEIRDNKMFVALNNENRSTGAMWGKTPNITPSAQQMAGIESKLTIGAGKDLKGAASDRDVAMFGRAAPSTSKDFEANANIATYNILRNQTELERRAFMRDYLEVNKSLANAERKWKQYLEANPFFKYPDKFDPSKLNIADLQINDKRKSYQDYFRSQSARGSTPVVRDEHGRLVIGGQ
jgi:hypothetical protein